MAHQISRRSALRLAGALLLALPSVGSTSAEPVRDQADAVAYESFSQIDGLAARGPTVLYFHASWCPTCQATMTSFRGSWHELKPEITLVIADYDKEAELKARYGVTYQNTYVQVGPDGAAKSIWNGGGIKALNEKTTFE